MNEDIDLWRAYPIHDKAYLCRLLDQPYQVLPAGNHWIKPIVSVEGLGYGAQRIEVKETCVIQPEAHGDYLCVEVDRYNNRRTHWTAVRTGVFFAWFQKLDGNELTDRQAWCVGRIVDSCPGRTVTAEFIGDYCIEAHARGVGQELSHSYRYTVPVWKDPDTVWDPPAGATVPADSEEIHGLKRRALLFSNSNPRALHDQHCVCGS